MHVTVEYSTEGHVPSSLALCVASGLSDSVDSGCQHMYLESPSCGASDLGEGEASMAALGEDKLALLEAIPTSPEVEVKRMCVRMDSCIVRVERDNSLEFLSLGGKVEVQGKNAGCERTCMHVVP